jgi:Tfp pilus assembly protein PilF
MWRGNAYAAKGNLVGAKADYGEAIKLDPRNVYAYASRAIAYYGKHAQAKLALEINTRSF